MPASPEFDSEARDADRTEARDAAAPDEAEESSTGEKRSSKGKVKFESVMQRSEAAAYFGALADGLRHGQLRFRHGDERLSLVPAQQVVVEVKASKKGDKEKVAFELEWRRTGEESLELDG